MTFYYTIINCGLGSKNADQHRAAVVQVLTSFGQTIVRAVIEGLTSDRPAYGLDKKKASPATVLWLIAKVSPEMLHALLLDALSNVSPEVIMVFRVSFSCASGALTLFLSLSLFKRYLQKQIAHNGLLVWVNASRAKTATPSRLSAMP